MPTKILAIDDSKTMRLAIKITFAAEDCEVVSISSGAEAVAKAKEIAADVLLIDAALGEGEPNGYEVCKAVKADPATRHIPVVMMVSKQVGIDDGAVQACGAASAILKPFETEQLIAQVQTLVSAPKETVEVEKSAPAVTPAKTIIATAPVAAPSKPPMAAGPKVPPPPTPSLRPPNKPISAPKPAAATLVSTPSFNSTTGSSMDNIPIAIPIPFAPAGAPTPGILKRLQQARGGETIELDPKVLEALVALSRDVIEQVVWEVVPDLAEDMLRQQRA